MLGEKVLHLNGAASKMFDVMVGEGASPVTVAQALGIIGVVFGPDAAVYAIQAQHDRPADTNTVLVAGGAHE